MQGLAILFGFQLLGVGLHAVGVPLPGSILGLLLFVISLFAGAVKLEWVENTSRHLLGNMLLFFAPIMVTTVHLLGGMTGQLWAILISAVVSLLAVMLTTGLVSHHLLDDSKSGPQEAANE